MATPSPVDSGGLVVTEKSWPAPPVASTTWSARTSTGPSPPPGGRASTPRAAAALHEEIEREPALEHGAGRAVGGVDEGPLDLGAGGGAAGVHDAGAGVAALAGQRQQPGGLAVELDPEGDQLVHAARALVDEDRAPPPRRTGRPRPPACRPGAGRSSPRRRPSTAATPPWAQRVADCDSTPLVSTPRDSDGDGRPARPAAPRPTGRRRRCPGPGRRRVRAGPRWSRRFGQRELGIEVRRRLVDHPVAPVDVHDTRARRPRARPARSRRR